MSLRIERVNQELKRQIMQIVQQEVDDPALELLSITRVETTTDLRESKVYFSLLDESKYSYAEGALNRMSKFILANVAKRIRIRILPKLKFIPDDSIKYSVEIYQKIEEISRNSGIPQSGENAQESN